MTRALTLLYVLLMQGWRFLRYLLGARDALQLGIPAQEAIGRVERVLIFGYMGMGDAVMFQPTLTALLREWRGARFDLVVSRKSTAVQILSQVAAAEGQAFERVYELDFKSQSWQQLREFNTRLRGNEYDVCVAVYTTPVSYFLSAIASARIRLGHTIRSQSWYRPRPNFIFNLARPVVQAVDEREPYRHFRLAQAVGLTLGSNSPVPILSVTQSMITKAQGWLTSEGLAGFNLVGVHIGVSAAMQWKKWPDSEWAQVFQTLWSEGTHFIFFGSESEQDQIHEAMRLVEGRSSVLLDADLELVIGVLSVCKLLLGNDSGLGHVAAAISVPSIRIFGPSDHFGCEPFEGPHKLVFKPLTCSPCMNLGLVKPGYNVHTCGHRNCLHSISHTEVSHAAFNILGSS